jgi:nucleoside-diphosphate-sugar epimerase
MNKPCHVVVGGGTAGCLLIRKLLENNHDVILILETLNPYDDEDKGNIVNLVQKANNWAKGAVHLFE